MVNSDIALRTVSMTGFASGQGAGLGHEWSWDIRSVNGKGFDLRLRLPEIEGLEAAVREAVAQRAKRGNITLNLRLSRKDAGEGLRRSKSGLEAAIEAVVKVEIAAKDRGITFVPPTPTDIPTVRHYASMNTAGSCPTNVVFQAPPKAKGVRLSRGPLPMIWSKARALQPKRSQ